MQDLGPLRLLDSLGAITAERDRERLRASLAATIHEILPADDIAFVQALPDASGQFAVQKLRHGRDPARRAARAPLPELDAGSVLERIGAGRHLEHADGVATLLLPVIHRDTLLEVLVVRAPAISRDAARVLDGIVRLYRNFLALLLDSERDPLTGLFNRRTLETRLAALTREAARRAPAGAPGDDERRAPDGEHGSYVAMLDIDHFKRINDTLGHLFGDEVLLLVSRLMREVFREDDLLFRYGGEEFAVVITAQTRAGALAAVDRFRARVGSHRFPQLDRVTVSAGLTAMRADELPAAAIARADQALYCAKEEGRNRVVDYDASVAAGRIAARRAADDVVLF